MPDLRIDRIDHVVLTVRDVDATCEFYRHVLGMDVVTFGAGRRALTFGQQKINVHSTANAHALVADRPTPGSGDLCFVTGAPLGDWMEHVKARGVALLEGPVARTGATGPIESIYFRDPDGNLIEISTYGAVADRIAPLRDWLREFSACVRAVDFDGGRRLCAADLVAFGTVAELVVGLDRVVEEQWRRVWPRIREFTIRADDARGAIAGTDGWIAAPWTSLGVGSDGRTYWRPGRTTIAFCRRDGRWLATHTHFSLSPTPVS